MEATPTLTKAQGVALATMTQHGRCVGARSTSARHGYVSTVAARKLVALGLARSEVSATGAHVFVITDEGWTAYWDLALGDASGELEPLAPRREVA